MRPIRFKQSSVAALLLTLILNSGALAWPNKAPKEEVDDKPVTGLQFPTLTARDWHQKVVTVPADLKPKYTCLVVCTDKTQQEQVDTWPQSLFKFEKEFKEFKFYEVMLVSVKYTPLRWTVERAIYKTMHNDFIKSRTLIAYTQVRKLYEELKLNDNSIHLFILDTNHKIKYAIDGPYSEENAKAIRKALEAEKSEEPEAPEQAE